MSVVYLAMDEQLGREVALKVLAPELAEDERFRQRFLHESRLAAGLDHPRIVPVHAAGEADGLVYIAMRYVRGRDLRQLLREEGPLEPERALALLSQVADALDAAHDAGLVHRDVKPGNVLLAARRSERDGEHAYLADFGLAKRPATVASATGAGLAGTIAYAAPEQIEGAHVDARADVYALGCLLYECLTGTPPFVRESELAVIFAHLQEPPPRITNARPELPSALDGVIAKALAKRPRDRYVSCGELVEAAREALPAGTAPPRRSRARTVAVAGVSGAVLVAIAGALLHSRARSSAPPAATLAAAPLRAPANSLALIDPRTNHVAAVIPLGFAPTALAAAGDYVWVASAAKRTLTRVSATTHRIVKTIPLDATPTGLAAAADGSVWVAAGLANELIHVRPIGGGDFALPSLALRGCCRGPAAIAVGGTDVWIANAGGLRRIGAATGAAGPITPDSGAASLAVSPDGTAWAADGWESVTHVRGARRTTIPVVAPGGGAAQPTGIISAYGQLWVAARGSDQLLEIDPDSQAISSTQVGHGPTAIAAAAGSIWVANTADGSLSRVPATAATKVAVTIPVGQRVAALATADGLVWAAIQPTGSTVSASGRLVLSTADYANGGIILTQPDGRRLQQLTHGAPNVLVDRDPRWSPDGRSVVFTRQRLRDSYLWRSHLRVIDAAGKNPRALTTGTKAESEPAWSPDGHLIAFQRAATPLALDDKGTIWVASKDGRRARRIGPACGAREPAWSPDGASIVFVCTSPRQRLYVMRRDGSMAHPIRGTDNADAPAWAPDGTIVTYADGSHVYIVDPAGGVPAEVLSFSGNSATVHRTRWSPDGSRLVLSAAYGDAYIAYADGSGLTEFPAPGNEADWQPTR